MRRRSVSVIARSIDASALDNRPLQFDEFYSKINQVVFTSATPGEFEKSNSTQIGRRSVSVIARSIDGVTLSAYIITSPLAFLAARPIDCTSDVLSEINIRTQRGERVLVTTLTKAMAEDLTAYLEVP